MKQCVERQQWMSEVWSVCDKRGRGEQSHLSVSSASEEMVEAVKWVRVDDTEVQSTTCTPYTLRLGSNHAKSPDMNTHVLSRWRRGTWERGLAVLRACPVE